MKIRNVSHAMKAAAAVSALSVALSGGLATAASADESTGKKPSSDSAQPGTKTPAAQPGTQSPSAQPGTETPAAQPTKKTQTQPESQPGTETPAPQPTQKAPVQQQQQPANQPGTETPAPQPTQQAPAQQTPVQQAPVQTRQQAEPVQQAPVQQAPVQQEQPTAPVQQTPAPQQTPVQQAPVQTQQQAPAQQAPVQKDQPAPVQQQVDQPQQDTTTPATPKVEAPADQPEPAQQGWSHEVLQTTEISAHAGDVSGAATVTTHPYRTVTESSVTVGDTQVELPTISVGTYSAGEIEYGIGTAEPTKHKLPDSIIPAADAVDAVSRMVTVSGPTEGTWTVGNDAVGGQATISA